MQAETRSPRRDWLWHPAAIVFISNACIMIIELVAGRLVAPIIGVSLYTWTSIIGVILAGVSVGNWLGGRLADRYASRRALGVMFIAAGLGALSVLGTIAVFGESGIFDIPALPIIVRMVLYISAIFLIPSMVLGLISPMVIKLTLRDLATTGSVIGRIYAASAIGSIAGTFATGYYLISMFGTRTILFGTGVVLIGLGILFGDWLRSKAPQALASMVLIGSIPFVPHTGPLQSPCLYETDYFCIRVRQEVTDGVEYKVLILDRLVHSYTAPSKPTALRYGYEMVETELAEHLVRRDGTLDMFMIGAGGYTLPKYAEFVYGDKATVEVAEIDPIVTQVAHEQFGLARDTRIKTFPMDARLFLKTLDPARKYSLVIEDAANDFSVPYHLTTREFNQLVRSHLRDDGMYVINILDGENVEFVGAVLRTLKQTYPHVYLVPNGRWLRIVNNTYLIVASPQALDVEALRTIDAGDGWRNFDAWLATDQELADIAGAGEFVLTDDYVPTDQLLAPMFEAIANRRATGN